MQIEPEDTIPANPDFLARATVALVPMPDNRRAPEADGLAAIMRTAMDASRATGASEIEIQQEAQTIAALQRRLMSVAYARGA